MKKTLFAAAALAVLGLAACSGNQKGCGNNCTQSKCDKDEMFTGVLPAADAPGVRYMLKLDYDDDSSCTKGDYDLVETYLESDSTATGGVKDGKSFKSEGDFTVEKQDGKSYVKLVQDKKDSATGSVEGPVYFLVDSDSTLTLVNSELQVSENSGLNYTLKLVK